MRWPWSRRRGERAEIEQQRVRRVQAQDRMAELMQDLVQNLDDLNDVIEGHIREDGDHEAS